MIPHEGDFQQVLPHVDTTYDLAFFDGYDPPGWLIAGLDQRLMPAGALVITNLDLGRGDFRGVLQRTAGWTTQFIADLAISTRT